MTLIDSIDHDVRSLELYFARLSRLLHEPGEDSDPPLDDGDANRSHSYTAFIRPDMLSNVYSLVDFWLNRICELSSSWRELSLRHKDIRGNNDLDARHKYLTKVASLNLLAVADSYRHLELVREIRNCFLHAGGHASQCLQDRLKTVSDVGVSTGLITIGDAFVQRSLQSARNYLAGAAEALQAIGPQ